MAKNVYPINAKTIKKWLSKAARINITCKENFVYITDGYAAVKFPAICWGDIAQDAVKMLCPADGESYEIKDGATEKKQTDVYSIFNKSFVKGGSKAYRTMITLGFDKNRSVSFFVTENGEYALINAVYADIVNYDYPGLNIRSDKYGAIMIDEDSGNFAFILLPISPRAMKQEMQNAYSEMAKALLENLYS